MRNRMNVGIPKERKLPVGWFIVHFPVPAEHQQVLCFGLVCFSFESASHWLCGSVVTGPEAKSWPKIRGPCFGMY